MAHLSRVEEAMQSFDTGLMQNDGSVKARKLCKYFSPLFLGLK